MKAMILAAGRGQRMGELTASVPKPLLKIADHYLIEYTLANLKKAGFHDIIMNISYHGEKIKTALKDGSDFGVHITYSEEIERLETGGGIVKALPLLGDEPFLVISADIITNYPLAKLRTAHKGLAHLIMVDNPAFHPDGDFGLVNGYADFQAKPKLTFGNIGVYHPKLFAGYDALHFPLREILFPAIKNTQVSGEYFSGIWQNIGSPEELKAASKVVIPAKLL